jgi:hypothetical protein
MRRLLTAAAAAALIATPALAGPVLAKDGRFEADVSTRQMSRISVLGEKIASVRKIDDPAGPQMLVETDEKSGDAFVAFDGDVAGRAFNAFLTTESGRVVQAILHPTPQEGQTILVRLEGSPSPASPPPAGAQRTDLAAAPPSAPHSDGRSPYQETLVQFIRLMFSDQESEGVTRRVATSAGVRAGPFAVREVTRWEAPGLRGRVLYMTNMGKADEPVRLEAFLVERVYAVAASHERLRPGEQGRVFIVEETQ